MRAKLQPTDPDHRVAPTGRRLVLADVFRQDPAYAALLGFAFCSGFSLPLARVALLVALAFTLRDVVRNHRTWRSPATGWAWIGFLGVAVVTTAIIAATNTDELIIPHRGLGKINKLLWFLAIPLVPAVVNSRERFFQVVAVFALGTGVEALRVLLLHTTGAWIQVTLPLPGDRSPVSAAGERLIAVTDTLRLTERLRDWIVDPWRARTFNDALAKLSGMATAQRLMVGALASLGLTLSVAKAPDRVMLRRFGLLTLLVLAGLVVALKRGPWISTLLVAVPLLMAGLGLRRTLPALCLAVALVAALPAARGRLAELPREFEYRRGGRALMWMQVVPGCRRDHPWGVGFRGLTNEAMRRHARHVEQRQNHVHSNPLQILVELGWQGLAAYVVWMLLALRDSARLLSRGGGWRLQSASSAGGGLPANGWKPSDGLLRSVPLAMIAALILNGLVEYNFADGELVLIYGMAMGLAAVRLAPPESEMAAELHLPTDPRN